MGAGRSEELEKQLQTDKSNNCHDKPREASDENPDNNLTKKKLKAKKSHQF